MIDWILAGFPKCSTTWLASHLNNHPGLTIQDGGAYNELQYFASEYHQRKGWSWYEDQFSEAEDGQLVGDYSARYCQVDYCSLSYHQIHPPREIYENIGPVPLIFSVRDPIDRMESQINHWIENGTFPEDVTMDELMEQEHGLDRQMLLLNTGRYWNSIRQFRDWWPDERIYVWVMEQDTVEHPMMSLQNLFTWLGVDPHSYPNGEDLTEPENERKHEFEIPDEWREKLARFYRKDSEELFLWMGKTVPDAWLNYGES